MVMNSAKDKIATNMTKFQLGTKPGHRAQEHLFVVQSCIQLYNSCGKAVIVQLYDIQKFFDREMLRDCMDSLYNFGIKGKNSAQLELMFGLVELGFRFLGAKAPLGIAMVSE